VIDGQIKDIMKNIGEDLKGTGNGRREDKETGEEHWKQ